MPCAALVVVDGTPVAHQGEQGFQEAQEREWQVRFKMYEEPTTSATRAGTKTRQFIEVRRGATGWGNLWQQAGSNRWLGAARTGLSL